MLKKHTFEAVIQNAGGGGAFVEVPFEKRPKVKALIEGEPYRGTLVSAWVSGKNIVARKLGK